MHTNIIIRMYEESFLFILANQLENTSKWFNLNETYIFNSAYKKNYFLSNRRCYFVQNNAAFFRC